MKPKRYRTSLKKYTDKELLAELTRRGLGIAMVADRLRSSSVVEQDPVKVKVGGSTPPSAAMDIEVIPASCSCGYPIAGPCLFNAPDCVVFTNGKRRPVRIEVQANEKGHLASEEDVANYDADED